jgi:hypothetical protein
MLSKVWGAVANMTGKTKETPLGKLGRKWPCIYRGNQLSVGGEKAPTSGVFVCEQMQSRICALNPDLKKQPATVTATMSGPAGQRQVPAGNCLACQLRCEALPRRPKITKRNLIYHCCPLKANDHWRANIAKLKEHIDIFNGKRLIATACNGPGETKGYATHRSSEVHEALAGCNCEFSDLYNDPILRERTTFTQLLLSIATDDPDTATFYAHSKGIATLDASDGTMPDDMRIRGSVRWRNAMYHHLLGRWQDVTKALRRYTCVGTTQIACDGLEQWPWPGNVRYGYWHFAGTFFWFRHDQIFTRPAWRNIPSDHYGVEMWLGGFIPLAESYSMLQPFNKFGPPPFRVYEPSTYGSEFDV